MYLPLNRYYSRLLAIVIIGLGFFMATPPGIIPDDILNIVIGTYLAQLLAIDKWWGIAISYPLGLVVIYIGALIYPYNTAKLLNSKLKQLKHLIRIAFTTPIGMISVIIGLIIMWYLFNWYVKYLEGVLI